MLLTIFLASVLLEKMILVTVLFLVTLTIAAYSTYGERKIAAFLQDRIGPDRAGPFGLLQPLADGVKMFMKEDFIPTQSERWLFILGPGIFMFVACMTSAVIPWGTTLTLFGLNVDLQVTDINIGILYVMGFVSLGVYGIMIGGWSSNNKYSLFGAIRASSQMISYELAMGLSIIAIVMLTGTLSLRSSSRKLGWVLSRNGTCSNNLWVSSSSSRAPWRSATVPRSTCRNAKRNWWAATTRSTAR
jgi:NADH-quinone oxidoreductase subunit H